ncbi:conserved hypothetical protein [Leptospira interrogans serovar Manilae]|uniref:Uncharacterized protein n=1 Tax=Leptospira interrogans serovar Manilae TaxID=214675 RepID=A0AAQ1SNY2_LEPIR|nr:hypothetical protein [Leptospira interrogans]AKP27397.1 hypothetical protein LIMLP_16670 [Leptospira interrogans serovar Manilae]AKP31167.1 hypothetical protein LIMHP_16660 [Leptospira interrogans serovar Manilae]EMJ56748.1 hypothetical protein LEP1GSC013_1810 [Leptospira interrogans serovar Valbuzzi str. Duyster]ENO70400.1 hypothetical protein LEP1GSC012_0104 [Leptospira interrogans serovar Valbuzzi str. Valbuzzi]EYU64732.1 hypothetical protein CI00_05635 [Leptospira interrogans serovar Ma
MWGPSTLNVEVCLDKEIKTRCKIGVSLGEPCPANCRQNLLHNEWSSEIRESCIAGEKMNAFAEGKAGINVGASAFLQALPFVLEDFISKGRVYLEILIYLLSIIEPEKVKEVIDSFSNKLLYKIIIYEYNIYQQTEDERKSLKKNASFLDLRENAYWGSLSPERICSFIAYCLKEAKDPEFASQFLTVLPSEAVSDLRNLAGLNVEEEKELYLSLKDGIYELPIQIPGIYRHILSLFEDDPEIFLILSTMEELVLRKQQIIESSHAILEKYKSGKLNHQSLFGDLSVLELEISMEILGIFEEKEILGRSEKNLIKELLFKHKHLKSEIT